MIDSKRIMQTERKKVENVQTACQAIVGFQNVCAQQRGHAVTVCAHFVRLAAWNVSRAHVILTAGPLLLGIQVDAFLRARAKVEVELDLLASSVLRSSPW